MATDHEISNGRDITWTLRAKQAPKHIREAWIGSWIVGAAGTRDSKPFQAKHVFLTSLRTTPKPCWTGAEPLEHLGLTLDSQLPAP